MNFTTFLSREKIPQIQLDAWRKYLEIGKNAQFGRETF